MMPTSLIIASLRLSKKSRRTRPLCFMPPMTSPKATEKTTRPRTKGRALGDARGKKQGVLKRAYKVEEAVLKTASTF